MAKFAFTSKTPKWTDLTCNYTHGKSYTNCSVGSIGPKHLEIDYKGSMSHKTLILVSIWGFGDFQSRFIQKIQFKYVNSMPGALCLVITSRLMLNLYKIYLWNHSF